MYTTVLPAMRDSLRMRIMLGDAVTSWILLECLNPPAVTLLSIVEDPRADDQLRVIREVTQLVVTQGSRVIFGVESDRPLSRVVARFDRLEIPLEQNPPPRISLPVESGSAVGSIQRASINDDASGSTRHRWWLNPEGSPLESVSAPQRIVFEITDSLGIRVEPPIEATIQVRPDYPPYVSAKTLTRFVLPSARPSLLCEIRDDLGLEKVLVRGQVIHPDGSADPPVEWLLWQRTGERTRVLQERWRIDLEKLPRRKGDRVELVVSAVDDRGPGRPGETTSSEPLVFEVTDQAGILAVMSEMDRKTAEELKAMIEKQLDVGGGP